MFRVALGAVERRKPCGNLNDVPGSSQESDSRHAPPPFVMSLRAARRPDGRNRGEAPNRRRRRRGRMFSFESHGSNPTVASNDRQNTRNERALSTTILMFSSNVFTLIVARAALERADRAQPLLAVGLRDFDLRADMDARPGSPDGARREDVSGFGAVSHAGYPRLIPPRFSTPEPAERVAVFGNPC